MSNNVLQKGTTNLRKTEKDSSLAVSFEDSPVTFTEEFVDQTYQKSILMEGKTQPQIRTSSVQSKKEMNSNSDIERGSNTLRKKSYAISFKDIPESINESKRDQISRRTLMKQETRQQIRSSIKESGQKMRQDVYSMLFLAEPFSPSFFFALFAIIFQYFILGFLMNDLIDESNPNNFLGIPPGVTVNVAVAQAFAVVLAALSCGDLLDALAFFDFISHREIFEIIPNATHCSWFFTWLLKFTEGSTSLIVTFFLLLKSETILSLFLNFAALGFVWAIDDVFFELAKNGFFGDKITEGAFATFIITLPKNVTKRSMYIRNFAFYLIAIALLITWGQIHYLQRNGHYLCNHILAQFDDSYEPVTSLFSGHFKLENVRLYDRVVYTNRRNTDVEYPFIGYCGLQKAWTLSLRNVTNEHFDSCANPLALSPTTATFDVTTEGSSWVSMRRNDTKRKEIPYSFMKVECIDCSKGLNPSRDTCSLSGLCGDDGLCKCTEGNYGISCEYKTPCPILVFPDLLEEEYTPLKNGENKLVLVQGKPVYLHMMETDENEEEQQFYIHFFNGYRWVLSHSTYFHEFNSTTDRNIKLQIADYLSKKFHPYGSLYLGILISAPMPQSLPDDGFEPTNLIWYNVKKDINLKHELQGSVSHESGIWSPLRCKDWFYDYYDDGI